MKPSEIVGDEEISNAWENANFGRIRSRKEVLLQNLLKIQADYGIGGTARRILEELGLAEFDQDIKTGRITEKGKNYLFHTLYESPNRISVPWEGSE